MREEIAGWGVVGVKGYCRLYSPLLRWYVEHGVLIRTVHRKIDYQATKIFMRFVEQLTETRRTGDVDKSKAQLAEVFKLLRNSSCGNPIEAAGAANMRYF